VHAFFHFVFTSLWFLFFFKQFNKTASLKLLIVAFIFSVFYGITIEVLQEVITLTRNADVFDVLANVSGALIAFGVCYILKRKKLKFNS
jgi:glycopeptide antibiotics resistance protein